MLKFKPYQLKITPNVGTRKESRILSIIQIVTRTRKEGRKSVEKWFSGIITD